MRIEASNNQRAALEYPRSHESPRESDLEWIILHCQHGKENVVVSQLEALQIETFIPWYRIPKRGIKTKRNLLRDYLFARSERIGELRLLIQATQGITHLVSDGEKDARIPNVVVDAIRNQLKIIDTTGFAPYEGNSIVVVGSTSMDLKWVFGKERSPKDRMLATLDVGKKLMLNT